jgi:D-serine dehydratase
MTMMILMVSLFIRVSMAVIMLAVMVMMSMVMRRMITLRPLDRVATLVNQEISSLHEVTEDKDASRLEPFLQAFCGVEYILKMMEGKAHSRKIEVVELQSSNLLIWWLTFGQHVAYDCGYLRGWKVSGTGASVVCCHHVWRHIYATRDSDIGSEDLQL